MSPPTIITKVLKTARRTPGSHWREVLVFFLVDTWVESTAPEFILQSHAGLSLPAGQHRARAALTRSSMTLGRTRSFSPEGRMTPAVALPRAGFSPLLSTAYSLYLAQKFLVSLVFTGDRLEAVTHR